MALSRDLLCSFYTLAGRLPGDGTAEQSPRPFLERVRAIADAGYVGMGFHLHDYLALRRAGHGDADLSAALAGHGLVHNELEFLDGWYCDPDSPEGRASAAAEADLYRAAAALHVHHVNVGELAGRPVPMERLQASFAALCRRGAERGVKFAIEVMPFSLIRDIATGIAVVGEAPANGGLVLDSWHMDRGGIAWDELLAIPPGRVIAVQLNDAPQPLSRPLFEDCFDRLLPGQGGFDLAGFIRTLDRIGFTAPPAVEIMSRSLSDLPAPEAARRSYEAARQVIAAALSV